MTVKIEMNMPEHCIECRFLTGGLKMNYCAAAKGHKEVIGSLISRQKWCPLKECENENY